jgi:hypothetical protein
MPAVPDLEPNGKYHEFPTTVRLVPTTVLDFKIVNMSTANIHTKKAFSLP